MDTNILTPKKLFQKTVRYEIPAFQRRYIWTQDKQWEPLWDDVRNTAENYLEHLDKADGNTADHTVIAEQNTVCHFLGAVVIQQVPTPVKDLERRMVIDGQQRFTTLQLLLDAVQYICEKKGIQKVAKRLSKLVLNDNDLVEDESDNFKLLPTINDREAFKHAMHNGSATENYEDSIVVQAHEYSQRQAEQWLGSNTKILQLRAEALEAVITGMLQIVVIDLGLQDDSYVIFETLNARGTPLRESDLIKNYVTSKTTQTVESLIWGDLDHDWWLEEIRQGRLYRPRIDALLDYWLEKHTLSEVSANKVFNAFRKVASNRKVEDVMSEVKTDLTNYRHYEEGQRKPIENAFHYRAGVMQMGAFTPVLLAILPAPEKARFGALQALESFLVRRMVCRDTTRGYNRLALDLVRELGKCKPDHVNKTVAQFLSAQEADSMRWPTDENLESALSSLPIYRLLTKGRLRLVLEGIEEKYRQTSLAEQIQVPKNLTIEHVLPQSWQTHWPLPENIDEHEAPQDRNELIHTIGNLTLVTGQLNSVASNAPWGDKCKTLNKHSVLHLNHHLLAEYRDAAWNEQTIVDRSRKMAALVADIWPGPMAPFWEEASE